LLLSVSSGPAAIAQAPTYDLQISDQVGASNRYRLTFEIRMRAEIQGQGQPDGQAERLIAMLSEGMTLRTTVEYEQELIAVASDGLRTFEVRWRDYQFMGELAGQEIPPPADYLAVTQELLSQSARVRTTPAGRTVEVDYSHPQLAGLARSFEETDGGMPTYLPEGPVSVGDRWTGVAKIPLGLSSGAAGNLSLELTHTLNEVREDSRGPVAVIALAGKYSQLQGVEESALGVPLLMEATLAGSSLFDITSGRFIGGHYELDMFALHSEGGVEIQLVGHADGNQELLNPR
jgi:hypothetical protein